MPRKNYLDYLRGLAIVFMAVNHVGHYLTASPIGSYGIYWSVYLTVTWAAPLFLFLAGYSLVAVEQKRAEVKQPLTFKYFWQRGLLIILAGVLINVFFYLSEEPWYFGRILLLIGSGIICCYPLVKYIKTKQSLLIALLINLGLISAYPLAHDYLNQLAASQSVPAKIFFGEFCFYPWLPLMFIGVIMAKYFLNLTAEFQARAAKRFGKIGWGLLIGWLALSLLAGNRMLFSFDYDFGLNGFWVPADLAWLWIFGSLLVFFSFMFQNQNKDYSWLRGLKVLGSNALAVYFLQFFIIKTIGGQWLNIRLTGFYQTLIADLIVVLILCYLVKSKTFARLMALNPLKAKAKTS